MQIMRVSSSLMLLRFNAKEMMLRSLASPMPIFIVATQIVEMANARAIVMGDAIPVIIRIKIIQ